MSRFVSILLFATLLASALAYSSLSPQRAQAATLSAQTAVQLTSATNQPQAEKRRGYGYWAGYHDGYSDGYDAGIRACYDFHRHRDGWTDEGDRRYRRGYYDGFRRGFFEGKHDCYDRGYDRDRDSHHGRHDDDRTDRGSHRGHQGDNKH